MKPKTMKLVAGLAGVMAFGTCQGQEGVWDKYMLMVSAHWAAEGVFGEEAQRRFNSTIGSWHGGDRGHVGVPAVPAIAERRLDEQLLGAGDSPAYRQGRPGGPHYGGGALHQSTAPGPAPVVARDFKMEPAHETAGLSGWTFTKHYYDENYIVDYEGDGHPEHRLNVDDNYFETYGVRASCNAQSRGGGEPPRESRRLHSLSLREEKADDFTDKILSGDPGAGSAAGVGASG